MKHIPNRVRPSVPQLIMMSAGAEAYARGRARPALGLGSNLAVASACALAGTFAGVGAMGSGLAEAIRQRAKQEEDRALSKMIVGMGMDASHYDLESHLRRTKNAKKRSRK